MKDIIKEIASEGVKKSILYLHPKFEKEYDEAMRYSEFKGMSKSEWIKYGEKGFQITISEWQLNMIDNTEGTSVENAKRDFDSLDPQKRKRFDAAIERGIIELPIFVKKKNGRYELIAGNTRFTGLLALGYKPHVWLITDSRGM